MCVVVVKSRVGRPRTHLAHWGGKGRPVEILERAGEILERPGEILERPGECQRLTMRQIVLNTDL